MCGNGKRENVRQRHITTIFSVLPIRLSTAWRTRRHGLPSGREMEASTEPRLRNVFLRLSAIQLLLRKKQACRHAVGEMLIL